MCFTIRQAPCRTFGNVIGDLDVPVMRQRITYQDAKQTLKKLTTLITKYLIAVAVDGAAETDKDTDKEVSLADAVDLPVV